MAFGSQAVTAARGSASDRIRMRLLFLLPQLPFPPRKGTQMRNAGLLQSVSARHEVAAVAFNDDDPRSEVETMAHCPLVWCVPTPAGRRRLDRLRSVVASPAPDLALRLDSQELRRAVAQAIDTFGPDVVQIEGLEVARSAPRSRTSRWALSYDAHNCEWLLQWRNARLALRTGQFARAAFALLESRKLWKYEGALVRAADGVVAVSEIDSRALVSAGPPRRITVVPNGVDTSQAQRASGPSSVDRVLFTGTLDFRPNVDGVAWFAREVWPRVRRHRPNATFAIVGRAPDSAIRALDGQNGIAVHADVPDVAPFFNGAAVFVVPLRLGGGARLKILESFAYEVPVVSTTVGAEGIAITAGRDIALVEDAAGFAAEVTRLCVPSPARDLQVERARRLVTSSYDWRVLAPRFDAHLRALTRVTQGGS